MGRLAAIIVLLLLNGFFVAAEFALVRSRRTRLEAMVRSGDRLAQVRSHATSNLVRVLSASQLGITLASLALGWVAESALGTCSPAGSRRSRSGSRQVGAADAWRQSSRWRCATFLHVVFGELAPRAVALNHPEEFARWLAPPLLAFAWLTPPFTWVLNRSRRRRAAEPRHSAATSRDEPVHSPEELRMLVEQSEVGGAIERQDAQLIEGVFEFSEKNAREVMTPRTEVVAYAARRDAR